MRGYQGILEEDFVPMGHRSVSNIINKGGTILKTARSKEFGTPEALPKLEGKKCLQQLNQNLINSLY
jgi:6-phosphofructokinase